MTRKAKIGIIGTGWWATTAHLPAIVAHPDADIAAICDQRPDVLTKVAERFPTGNVYTDYRKMIETEDLDGVVVAVWHAAHYEVTRECLERKLHVLVEKPLTLSAKHARELIDLAGRVGRELIVGYPYHFCSRALQAREVIRSNELGEVRYVNGYFASSAIDFYRGDDQPYGNQFKYPVIGPGNVYSDPSRSGGGQGHLQLTHLAALVHFITGLKPIEVIARMSNLDVKVDVIDAIIGRMHNGALISLGSTGNLQTSDPGKLAIQINCDRGWLDIDFVTGGGKIRHVDGSDEILPSLNADSLPNGCDQQADLYPLHAPVLNLVKVIVGDEVNGSPAEVGWRTVELLDAAYRSAEEDGQAVRIESLYDSLNASQKLDLSDSNYSSHKARTEEERHEVIT